MASISWIVGGTQYSLDDFTYAKLLNHDGFGLPPIRRLEESGPNQHGVTDRGFRYDAKVIVLTLGVAGNTLEEFYQKRNQLANIFKARNTPGRLRFQTGSVVRDIYCNAIGDSLSFSGGRSHTYQTVAVALRCPDPTWYDPTSVALSFLISIGENLGVIPMLVPMQVGKGTLDATRIINYAGTAETFPRIRITGPVDDAVITHQQTGLKLDFDGVTISAGTWVEIDTRYGVKTVIDSTGANRIADLTSDSDLALFSILPSPEVSGGVNTLRVTGDNVSGATGALVTFSTRFIGV